MCANKLKGKPMPYKNPHLLWSTNELNTRLNQPDLIVLDLRSPEDYANGHIPGANSFDIFGISLVDTREEPLKAFLWIIEHLIQAKGVSDDSRIVVYDRVSGERAARLFWFLEFFGHKAVHILDGGFDAWVRAKLPIGRDGITPKRGDFRARPQRERLATADDILQRLDLDGVSIIDTRSEAENRGKLVRAARGGRIPGSIHLEWTHNLKPDGTFKSAESLESQYVKRGITADKEVIVYCQGGYRSANTYVALRLVGYPLVRNSLGSWGEWGNRHGLPIEQET